MNLKLESIELQLDIARRIKEDTRGEKISICLSCLTPLGDHYNDNTHVPVYWPLEQVIIRLEYAASKAK